MVCESDENRMLAEFLLSTIMKFIQEYVTSHEQGNAEVSQLKYIVIIGLINKVILFPSSCYFFANVNLPMIQTGLYI